MYVHHVGSSLQQLSTHIPKLLHYAGGLIFGNVLPSNFSAEHTPQTRTTHSVRGGGSQITGIVSVAGEKMNLNQVHTLDGGLLVPLPGDHVCVHVHVQQHTYMYTAHGSHTCMLQWHVLVNVVHRYSIHILYSCQT